MTTEDQNISQNTGSDTGTTGTDHSVTEEDLTNNPELKDEGIGVGDKIEIPNVGEEDTEEETEKELDTAQGRDTGNLYSDGLIKEG